MNCLWTLVWLMNITTYKRHADKPVKENEEVLFQITRRSGNYKINLVATYNPATGIYTFDYLRFATLDDMLSHVLFVSG